MLELEGIPLLLMLAFWIYCVFDAINADESRIRNLPKLVWVFIVLIFFDVGAIAWFVAGRPRAAWQPTFTYGDQARTAPRGPAADVDFLQRVDRGGTQRRREAEVELNRREEELRRREEELRRRDGGNATPD